MGDCPFFHQDVRYKTSQEIRADRMSSVSEVRTCWCEHKHSPVTEQRARSVAGGAVQLKCDGEISQCQVPADKIADIYI